MKKKSLFMTVAIIFIAMISTAQQNGTFTDYRDGKTYKTVKIGTQTWMAENLAYKTSSDCWAYDNKVGSAATYGYLYDWKTAKNVCPTGWHLPTDAEWKILISFLGGESVAGDKLKEIGTSHWDSNSGATNSSGFKALPGGYRSDEDLFSGIGSFGKWWSSTFNGINGGYIRTIEYGSSVDRHQYGETYGFSVRCVKD